MKFKNPIVLKDLLALVVISLQEHLWDSQKKKKHIELDEGKVIYEHRRKWDISISKENQIRSNTFRFQESEGLVQEEAVST